MIKWFKTSYYFSTQNIMTFPVNIKALKEIDKSYQKSHLLVNYICVRIMARSILDLSLDTGLLTFCNKL